MTHAGQENAECVAPLHPAETTSFLRLSVVANHLDSSCKYRSHRICFADDTIWIPIGSHRLTTLRFRNSTFFSMKTSSQHSRCQVSARTLLWNSACLLLVILNSRVWRSFLDFGGLLPFLVLMTSLFWIVMSGPCVMVLSELRNARVCLLQCYALGRQSP